MTDEPKPVPSLKQLEASARKLLNERVLNKGDKMPSEKAVDMAVKAMASKAHRELSKG